MFEREHEEVVRVICLNLFGLDGHPESLEDTVDLEVMVNEQVVSRTVFETTGRPLPSSAARSPRRCPARTSRGLVMA